jgi:hypothetical protein
MRFAVREQRECRLLPLSKNQSPHCRSDRDLAVGGIAITSHIVADNPLGCRMMPLLSRDLGGGISLAEAVLLRSYCSLRGL